MTHKSTSFYRNAIKTEAAPSTVPETATVDETLGRAKRAFALKKYEQAVDFYATALELLYVTRPGGIIVAPLILTGTT